MSLSVDGQNPDPFPWRAAKEPPWMRAFHWVEDRWDGVIHPGHRIRSHGGPGLALGAQSGRISLDRVNGRFVKDPSFVDDGKPLGGQRYIAAGDLSHLFLKGFETRSGGLEFSRGEIPVEIGGLPAELDGLWAPEIVVRGDRVLMFYAAGRSPAGHPFDWNSFRVHAAEMPLPQFIAEAHAGGPVHFQDHGTVLRDLAPYGPHDPHFAVIDPHLYTAPDGRAYLTYVVVKHRPEHSEQVRIREVDPRDPTRTRGPDRLLFDGALRAFGGVAEAPDTVVLDGKPYVILSVKPGDMDQQIVVAPLGAEPSRLTAGQLRSLLTPRQDGAQAAGSTHTVVIDGTPYMLYQRLADDRFGLAWRELVLDPGSHGA